MTDPLPEIKARWRYGNDRQPGAPLYREQLDVDTLIGEVERLRRLVDKPLFAIWQQVEAETREKWFGEHDLREENRRLRELLAPCGYQTCVHQHVAAATRPTSLDPPEDEQP
jgi:hypothetical protein